MLLFFVLLFAVGLGISLAVPLPKNRLHRMAAQYGTAGLVTVGILGFMYQLVVA